MRVGRTQGRGERRATPRAARVDFAAINAAALARLPELVAQLLPGGRERREWVCGDLTGRAGRSCKVNLVTGRWADFATGDKGGEPVSLAAAVWRCSQSEAARRLAQMLGLEGGANG
ncbi:MAG: hypothetical protein N3D18_08020 [Roseococcus sp.]|nr:hypothetical protein [Roseococcus sp.]